MKVLRPAGLLILTLLLVCMRCVAATPALASTEGPGWQLYANSYPTNITQGTDEVQTVQPDEEGGTFTLGYEGAETPAIPDRSEPLAIQAAIEALPTIGDGNVAVTGTPGNYTVTFIGDLGSTKAAELEATGAAVSISVEGLASGTIGIDVFNVGAASSVGPITVTDVLPAGLRAKEAGLFISPSEFLTEEDFGVRPRIVSGYWDCSGNGTGPAPGVAGATVVTCTNDPTTLGRIAGGGGSPTFSRPGQSGNNNPQPAIGISVEVEAGSAERVETNHISIVGGGAIEPAAAGDPIAISSAPAKGGLVQADAWFSNADGTIDHQAGSQPYTATFIFTAATAINPRKEGYITGSEIRNLETRMPPGLIGNLHSIPQCTREQLSIGICPVASLVGRLKVQTVAGFNVEEQVFNLVPAKGTPAELGFIYSGVPVYIRFGVRSGSDDSVVAYVENIAQKTAYQSILTLWGVPEDPTHDLWRSGTGGCSAEELEAPPLPPGRRPNYCVRQLTRSVVPFLRLPTSCGSPQDFAFRELNGWQEPDAASEVRFPFHGADGVAVGFSGCQQLSSEPAFTTSLETASADTPTGLSADLSPPVGGLEELGALSPADIKDATVTLPAGVAINPGQAAGLQACPAGRPGPLGYGNALTTPEEAARGEEDTEAASCPPASRVGTVRIESPLIEASGEKQFDGSVYVMPSDPPEVKLLIAASADGVNLKLPGTVDLDPQTGRLTATFADTPQLPFTDFRLHFEGGSRAALISPSGCGTYETKADFTPWSTPFSADAFSSTRFAISTGSTGAACPPSPLPFSPTLAAGTTNPVAGASSSFTLDVSRPDGQQNIETIQTTLPEGQLAKLAGVPLCPEAAAPSGDCPSGSQVGSVSAEVGAGADPLQVPQPGKAPTAVYLAGPYKGAPYSLVVKVPAQAGPFDLGTVVTRVALRIDESTTQVTAASDPLPQILDGVPLTYKGITVHVDRPGFIQNPTDCEPMKVDATIAGSEGAGAAVSNRYQVGDCASLAFRPGLKLSLTGQTRRTGHPGLKAVLTYPKGPNANIARAQVNLPHSEFLDQGNLNKTCTRPVLIAGKCPKTTVYGKAKAWSPLLDRPLEGPVYLVGGYGYKLPALVAELDGQIRVLLVGKVDTGPNKGIRNTFEAVPDAPVSRFELTLKGGKKYSLLENSENLCSAPQKAIARFTGQNGKTYDTEPLVANSCGKKSKGRKSSKGSHKKGKH